MRGGEPVETRRGLPGDPDDTHSRYIEAAIGGLVVGCLYLPNSLTSASPRRKAGRLGPKLKTPAGEAGFFGWTSEGENSDRPENI